MRGDEESQEDEDEVRYTRVEIVVNRKNPSLCGKECVGYDEDDFNCKLFPRKDGTPRKLEEDDDGNECRCKPCLRNEVKDPARE